MAFNIMDNLQGIGEAIVSIRTAITGEAPLDPNKRAELEMKTLEIGNQIALAQAEINKMDAQSGSLFRGGWRPAVGWLCVFGLFYSFFLQPLLPWVLAVFGILVKEKLPGLDMGTLMMLLGSLLGIGSLRTYEKVNGASK